MPCSHTSKYKQKYLMSHKAMDQKKHASRFVVFGYIV